MMTRTVVLFLLLSVGGQLAAESRGWRTAKRIAAISGCAAQALDLATTLQALQRGGNFEANPLLRGSNGGLRWSVAVPTKSVACALPFLFNNPKLDKFWTFYGAGQTGLYTTISARNAMKR